MNTNYDFKLYVGTYGKYNAGSIEGAWLSLLDYETLEDFFAACRELHKDESDPEFMFQDFDGEDFGLYSEYGVSDKLFALVHAVSDSTWSEDVISAYVSIFDPDLDDIEDLDNVISNRYFGEFESNYDLGVYLIDECGCLNVPEDVKPYIDYEAYGRDSAFSMHEFNGVYFYN